ncbi:YHYH domain-containing protein [Methylomonas sp. MED-D]|uniref:YHYH domain-containing protein n=1 Tax=unclassified Methylomonas TaxID=2608980 RepID=UPI0028A54D21|nr:YHYH domain-containing protein [Methylomonas sp. MV1]MDT4330861.1 YHYH domain-containing protein [Methylomonas sp. MV1]
MTKLAAQILSLPIALLAAYPLSGAAHPGKINAEGCHTERKTGDYHYPGPRPVSSTLSLT